LLPENLYSTKLMLFVALNCPKCKYLYPKHNFVIQSVKYFDKI